MELSSSEKKAFKNYILGIGKGLFTDVDFFVNYNSWRPELVIMVDVDWDMLSEKYKEHAYNYNMFLTKKFKDDVETFFKMMDIKFSAKIEFDIMNWE